MVDLVCPHCGFSKSIEKSKLPPGPARVTCPKCRQGFPLPAKSAPGEPQAAAVTARRQRGSSPGAEGEERGLAAAEAIVAVPAEAGPAPILPPGGETSAPDRSPAPQATASQPTEEIASEITGVAPEEVTVECPHCGFQRRVKKEILPERPSRVSCRSCRRLFPVSRELGREEPSGATPEDPPAALPEGSADLDEASGPPAATAETGRKLPGIEELFGRSWTLFKARIWTFLGILLLGGVLAIVPALLVGQIQQSVASLGGNLLLTIVSAAAALILALFVSTWTGAALFYAAVDEELGVRPCLGLALQRLWAWMWLFGLAGFLVTGAGLLFVLPGVLFSVWFFFSQYILAAEDVRGMEALLKSREYVRGYAWPVFLRLLVLWLLAFFLTFLLAFIPLLGPLLSFLVFSFAILYQGVLYRDLREIKGDLRYACSPRAKGKWLGIAAIGWVFPATLTVALLLPQWEQFRSMPNRDTTRAEAVLPAARPVEAPKPEEKLTAIEERPEELMIALSAINYAGTVRINGEEIFRLGGEENLTYDYTTGSEAFLYGTNVIQAEYLARPEASIPPQLHLRVYRPDGPDGAGELLAEWEVGDQEGTRDFYLEVPVPREEMGEMR